MEPSTTAEFIGLLIAPLMALAVGYFTKASWPGKWKSILLLGLAAINGFVVELFAPHPDGFDLKRALMQMVLSFVIAVGAHYGLWKPTNAANAAANAGVKD